MRTCQLSPYLNKDKDKEGSPIVKIKKEWFKINLGDGRIGCLPNSLVKFDNNWYAIKPRRKFEQIFVDKREEINNRVNRLANKP